MAWTPFSAETIRLDSELRKLHRSGQTSAALDLITAALEKAHRDGPSNITYEQFEAEADARK